MKLRVRSASDGGGNSRASTLRLELPADSCTLSSLIAAIRLALGSSPAPPSISISLNKRDILRAPHDALLSDLGIRSGDLLFYLQDSAPPREGQVPSSPSSVAFLASEASRVSPQGVDFDRTHPLSPPPPPPPPPDLRQAPPCHAGATATAAAVLSRRELCASAATRRAEASATQESPNPLVGIPAPLAYEQGLSQHTMDADMETCAEHDSATPSTTDGMAAARTDDVVSGSIPSILNRVLMAEHRNIRQMSDLLILAVHAVMLETGFVLVVEGLGHEAYSLGGRWTGGRDLDASYTVPNIREAANRTIGHVVLRSQTLGNNMIMYGAINNMGSVGALQPVLRLVMKASKYLVGRSLPQDGGYIGMFSDPFALWKCVKDELSLPLLTAFCKEAGLPPPPSLLRLPMDLKVKILEGLPALDLARAGSVCSELRYLCANNELWKRLFVQEFGLLAAGHGPQSWKNEFARRYVERKRALERRPHHRPSWYGITPRFTPRFPSRRGIIGGDYDLYPSIGHGPFGGGMFGSGGASGSGGFLRSLHDRERSGQDMLGLTIPHDDSSFY